MIVLRIEPQRKMPNQFRSLIWLMCSIFAIGLTGLGCVDSNQKMIHTIQVETSTTKENRDSLREAFRYLPQLIRLDRTAAMQEISHQLNSWSDSIPNPPNWTQSKLLESISPQMRSFGIVDRLSAREFGEPECEFMLQCTMMQQVGKWVLDRPYRDRLFSDWLESQKSNIEANEWSKLEAALKLFDWTICNVALDGNPTDAERLLTNPDVPLNDAAPIYRQLPWQTMMFGHADAWARARLFTQLCFAQGIDTVVLALPDTSDSTSDSASRLWCVGVPIANDLYLFEPHWGLPFPVPTGNGVATLKQAREDASVLRRAKLPGRFEYPVEAKDLKSLIALVDVEPFALGRSMFTLEKSLTGEIRHRLSFDGDAFANRMKQIDGDLKIRLWNAPWLSHMYNLTIRMRLDDFSPFSMSYMEQNGVFITDTPISLARTLHFKGQFESTIDAPGALRTYMDFRVDDETLKDLEYDRETQKALGVTKRPTESMESFVFRVKQAQKFYRRSKFDIGVFLAMANMDLSKPETAADWLTKRTLQVKGTERWHAHAHYLLGRNYETLGNMPSAIEEYKFEASPQAAGNRIRIRKLESGSNPSPTPEVN